MKTINCVGNPENKLLEYKRQKKNFTMVTTAGYTSFTSDSDDYSVKYRQKRMNPNFMGLVSQLRADVNRNIQDIDVHQIPDYTNNNIEYFRFNPKIIDTDKTIKGVLEYDVTKAYYQSAYRLGYISDKFYKKSHNISKSDRLRLLGTLAVNKYICEYKNGVAVDEYNIRDRDETLQTHAKVWFHICKHVSMCLGQFAEALGDDFYFFWVDGIYFSERAEERAKRFALYSAIEYKLEFTQRKVSKMRVINEDHHYKLLVYKGRHPSKFSLPQNGGRVRSTEGEEKPKDIQDILNQPNEKK